MYGSTMIIIAMIAWYANVDFWKNLKLRIHFGLQRVWRPNLLYRVITFIFAKSNLALKKETILMPIEGSELLLDEIAKEVRVCKLCILHKGRKNAVPSEGSSNAKLILIGEAPESEEDEQGRPS